MPRANYTPRVCITTTRKWLGKAACGKRVWLRRAMVLRFTAQAWLNRSDPDTKKLCKECVKTLRLVPDPLVVVDMAVCTVCKEVVLVVYGKGGCRRHKAKHLEMVNTWDLFLNRAPKRRRKK